MINKILILLVLAAVPLVGVVAQEPTPDKPTQAADTTKSAYEALLERVKKGDQSVDFKELRFAFTETSKYSPYGGDREKRKTMVGALNDKQYDKALAAANAILDSNYLDMMANFAAYVSNRELSNSERATYHRFVFDGLLNSIKNSGDGKTPETAFVVISTDEEYVLFNFLGLRVQSQSLEKVNGHSFDKMTALDPKTDKTTVYYFNVDKPLAWLGKSLSK